MSEVSGKPTPPEPWECCGGGSCCPCVWDRYYDALAEWRANQATAEKQVQKTV